MSTQNSRFSKGLFQTMPEDGAQIADLAETLVPGGRGFVQQMFRAKKDLLKGVSHLLDAQIRELDGIDSAIADEARRRPPAPPPPSPTTPHRPVTPGLSMGEVLKRAGEMLFWKPKSSHSYSNPASARQYMPESLRPSTPASAPSTPSASTTTASASSAGNPPAIEAPEKIKIT
jgi:hypothetical protein